MEKKHANLFYSNKNLPPSSDWDNLLISGSFSRTKEFIQVFLIAFEFIRGFRIFHFVGPCITFFGSARTPSDHHYYLETVKISAAISKLGFTIMTGGGPGIMEAANKGAFEAGGTSVAANISLPHEQALNVYTNKSTTFRYFFVRKTMLVKYSYAFIFMPGGYGTLDEAAEALTLISTGKLTNFPLIFVGKEYWQGLQQWIQNTLLKNNMISPNELSLVHLTDDLDEVISILKKVKSEHKKSFDYLCSRKKI